MTDHEGLTKNWIKDFVIKFDLCPFAQSGFDQDRIYYQIAQKSSIPDLF